MYCIQEIDKPSRIKNFFNIIKLEKNKIILPITGDEISMEKADKLAKKTVKILSKANSRRLVISKKIKEQTKYLNYLNTYGFDIIDGKWLFEVLSCEILDYVLDKKKLKKEEVQISILVNSISEITLFNIKKIVKEYKSVNIVTNHMEKFKKIEEQILDEYGIMITITNNKKKSLLKSKVILNVDFPEELINRYNIFDEAIIVNVYHDVKIKKKRFNGVNVNNYEIGLKEEEYIEEDRKLYDFRDLYEAYFYKKQSCLEIFKKIEKDKVYIKKIFTVNGIL